MVIEKGVEIGDDVRIGVHAVILSGSVIEEECDIEANCIIGHPTKLEIQKKDFSAFSPKVQDLLVENPLTRIGQGSIVRSGSIVYKNVIVGKKARIGHGAPIREHTTIGAHVVIGSYAQVDGYTKIGDQSKIGALCVIAQSTRIGKGAFIAAGSIFTDNKRIVLGEGLNGARVQDYVRIGGGVRILPEIVIGKFSLIGAGTVVTKNVPEGAICYGNPIKIIRYQTDEEIQAYVRSLHDWE